MRPFISRVKKGFNFRSPADLSEADDFSAEEGDTSLLSTWLNPAGLDEIWDSTSRSNKTTWNFPEEMYAGTLKDGSNTC